MLFTPSENSLVVTHTSKAIQRQLYSCHICNTERVHSTILRSQIKVGISKRIHFCLKTHSFSP